MKLTALSSLPFAANFPTSTPDQPYLTTYTYRDATKVTTRNSLGASVDFKLSRHDRLT